MLSSNENGRGIHQNGRGVVIDVDGQPNGIEEDDPLDGDRLGCGDVGMWMA